MADERKTAIVTGASRGIGLAIAKKLAKSGYNIAVVDACDLGESESHESGGGIRRFVRGWRT